MKVCYKPVHGASEQPSRRDIAAKWLLSTNAEVPEIPKDFPVTKLPAKVARGAYKARYAGDAKGAQTTSRIYASADRRNLVSYATKGIRS